MRWQAERSRQAQLAPAAAAVDDRAETGGGRWAAAAAVAGVTPKASGQDRCAVLTPAAGMAGAGLVICDGVGSFAGSGDVAQECVEVVRRQVAQRGLGAGVLFSPSVAASELQPLAPQGATTLIAVAADAAGYVFWSFVGNGSLSEIEASDVRGGRARLLVSDLALPQVGFEGGRPALRSVIPAIAGAAEPEVASGILLPRDQRTRLLLACSDGITSQEDWRQGTSSAGTVLRAVPPPLVVLLDHLALAWPTLESSADPRPHLHDAIGGALEQLLSAGTLEDDATAGALLLRGAQR